MEKVLSDDDIQRLEKAGYRFAGKSKHSAVKICNWTREALRGNDVCYKQKFYGINTHRCLQMTPAVPFCTHKCTFCWRDTTITYPEWVGPVDDPVEILDGCIEAQREILQGFKGNENVEKKMFEEAMNPNQVAISLAGEPTLYPRLSELVDEINSRGATSFLVTNGTQPEMIKTLMEHEPYQLYMTLPAPDKQAYMKTCCPIISDGWERIQETLSLLNNFNRSVVRLTLARGMNLLSAEKYAEMVRKSEPRFVEVKSYMAVGFSRKRLGVSYMPMHEEMLEFAQKIADNSGYRITNEKPNSRVVLLEK